MVKEFKVIDFNSHRDNARLRNLFFLSDAERLFGEVKEALLQNQSVVISFKEIEHCAPSLESVIGGLYAWGHAYKSVPDFKKKIKIKDIEGSDPDLIRYCLGQAIWWASTPERIETNWEILQRACDGDYDYDEEFDDED